MKPLSRFGFILGLLGCFGSAVEAQDLRLPTIIADIVIDRTFDVNARPSSEQRSIGKFYRDSAGRTRIDQDGMITINDPVKGIAILLNLQGHVGTTMLLPSPPLATAETPESPESPGVIRERTTLGTRVIEGLEATGIRMVAAFPMEAFSRVDGDIVQTIEIWHSERLGIPLLSTVSSSLSGQVVTRYTNIQENAPVGPELFAVPAGFELVGP